jgi:hypothetical protein
MVSNGRSRDKDFSSPTGSPEATRWAAGNGRPYRDPWRHWGRDAPAGLKIIVPAVLPVGECRSGERDPPRELMGTRSTQATE